MPVVARVVPDVTGLDKQFDYLIPEHLRDEVRVGTMVRVALSGRRVGGWVVAVGPPDEDVPAAKLRPLAKVTGHGPSAALVDLAAWASHRWAAGRLRPFLVAASPARAVPVLPAPARSGMAPGPVDAGAARLLAERRRGRAPAAERGPGPGGARGRRRSAPPGGDAVGRRGRACWGPGSGGPG